MEQIAKRTSLNGLAILFLAALFALISIACNSEPNEQQELSSLRKTQADMQRELNQLQADLEQFKERSAARDPEDATPNPDQLAPVETPTQGALATAAEVELQYKVERLQEELEILRANPEISPVAGNICQRSIAIQEELLEKLQIQYCRYITGEELIRVTNLEIRTDKLKPGDLAGLQNLDSLSLTLTRPPPKALFKGLNNLTSLELSFESPTEPSKVKDLFGNPLGKLSSLTLNGGAITQDSEGLLLEANSLANIPNLEEAEIRGIRDLHQTSFTGLTELQKLGLHTWNYNNYEADSNLTPDIPANLIKDLPQLTRFNRNGFIEPDTMEVADHKVACMLRGDGQNPQGERVKRWTVEGQITRVISHNDGACRLGLATGIDNADNEVYTEELLIDTSSPD